MLLYTGGIYLILIGILALLSNADIYIGFLWVIDLGVGLVFFIFILHFSSFLFQKSSFNLSAKHFIFSYLFLIFSLIFFYYFSNGTSSSLYSDLNKNWFFKISFIDYYSIYFSNEVTDLNTIKDSYFLLNSFEFFIINFSLFFGLITAILLSFITHRIFNFLNFSQINNILILNNIESSFFIKNQNFVKQTNSSMALRVWNKLRVKKNINN
jgi:hypothetical protein